MLQSAMSKVVVCGLALVALLAVTASDVQAQRMGPASVGSRGVSSPHFAANGARFASGPAFSGTGFGPSQRFGYGFYPRAFYPLAFGDPFYADLLSQGYPVASQPPMIFMQVPAAASESAPMQASSQVQPLMIELQGDRYVRIGADETAGAEMIEQEPRPEESGNSVPTAAELPPAVLVFRDGHREEVSDYTIADGALYTRANYYTDGSWTRKIELSSLNLAETAESNQSRGVPFRLPSAPNEVIVRP
jgi:hypothetical protein